MPDAPAQIHTLTVAYAGDVLQALWHGVAPPPPHAQAVISVRGLWYVVPVRSSVVGRVPGITLVAAAVFDPVANEAAQGLEHRRAAVLAKAQRLFGTWLEGDPHATLAALARRSEGAGELLRQLEALDASQPPANPLE